MAFEMPIQLSYPITNTLAQEIDSALKHIHLLVQDLEMCMK